MKWNKYLLTRKHSTPVMCVVLCIGIIYFAATQYALKLPAHEMLNGDHFIVSQHMQSLDIRQSIECWQQILFKTVINQLIPTKIHPQTKGICPFKIDEKLLQTKSNLLTELQHHTKQLLHDIQIKQYMINQHITYRQLLSLHRTIMIIYQYHNLETHKEYHSLSHIIHQLKHTLVEKNKIYFNIHISKSGGTSICDTFHKLPFIPSIETPPGSVCNYQWTNDKSSNCESTYERSQQYDMVARENALDVFYDTKNNDYHPKLCDGFIYLLPFRHPFEKSFSWAQGDNVLSHNYRTQFYKLKTAIDDEEQMTLNCVQQAISINGYQYNRIIKGDHYQNFFVKLFDSENVNERALNSWKEVLQEQFEYKQESDTLNVSLPECMKREQEDQHWIYTFFNKENKVGAHFMMKYRKSQWPFPGLRLPRSSSANTFTSWLGFGDLHQWPMSAQLNPRFMIQDQHFMHACLLILEIDHVLPFWRYLEYDNIDEEQRYFGMNDMAHPIWKVTYLQMIKHFTDKGYVQRKRKETDGWSHGGHTTGRNDHVHSHIVALNVTDRDMTALRKNNQYDLALFRLAQWIAKVDVDIYDLLDSL